MVFQNQIHPFFPMDSCFPNWLNEPGAIIADKTCFIPLLEEQSFRYMFLRPRRWGKSAFLNMLATYYDVKAKHLFEGIFKDLFIGKNPTKSRNSHLVLLFDFSTINPRGSQTEIKESIFQLVSESLRVFLLKYNDILSEYYEKNADGSPMEPIVPNSTGLSLGRVLVSKFGAGIYHDTKHVDRVLLVEVPILLSLASTSMMLLPTVV
jgi:hypothetical protein